MTKARPGPAETRRADLTAKGVKTVDKDLRRIGVMEQALAYTPLLLIALAVPSIFIGWFTVGPVALGDFFRGAILQSAEAPLAEIAGVSTSRQVRPTCGQPGHQQASP
jgi:hypothetical protein